MPKFLALFSCPDEAIAAMIDNPAVNGRHRSHPRTGPARSRELHAARAFGLT